MSIQKTQPTICAARKQTIRFSVGGVTLDASIDCMKIDIVSVIPGRYAHALIGLTTLPIFRFIIQVERLQHPAHLLFFDWFDTHWNKLRLRGSRWRGANFIRLAIEDSADGD